MKGFYLNEDNSNFFASFPESEMTLDGVRKFILGYAGKQVGAVVISVNSQRASYDSKAIEPIWIDVTEDASGKIWFRGQELKGSSASWVHNAKKLHDDGIDVYKVWIDTLHEVGRQAWVSCRMNDLHDISNDDSFMHDKFWREHPEFRRAEYLGKDNWFARAFDFAHPEVRENKLALLTEQLERYDVDGLELDWTRFPAFLRPGCEMRDAHLITDLIRRIREISHEYEIRRGHKIRIGARVMSSIEDNLRFGLDVVAWANEGFVDMLTIGNFWPTVNSDIPFETWRAALGNKVELNAGLELTALPYSNVPEGKLMPLTKEMIAAYTSEYLYRGADNIYLFNLMNGGTGMHDNVNFKIALDNCALAETANAMMRRHVLTFCTRRPQGIIEGYSLPRKLSAWQSFRLNVGGGTENREAFIIFGLDAPAKAEAKPAFYLNGEKCETAEARQLSFPSLVKGQICAKAPAGALHDGDNVIDVKVDGDEPTANWCEITLMEA